jgi:hypothetical protein
LSNIADVFEGGTKEPFPSLLIILTTTGAARAPPLHTARSDARATTTTRDIVATAHRL